MHSLGWAKFLLFGTPSLITRKYLEWFDLRQGSKWPSIQGIILPGSLFMISLLQLGNRIASVPDNPVHCLHIGTIPR